MATPIGITLQRSILYTLASFCSYYSPTLPNPCICASFQIQTLSTCVGGAKIPTRVYETCSYPLHMVKSLGKQHESKKISLNIFVNRLSLITKKGRLKLPVWF